MQITTAGTKLAIATALTCALAATAPDAIAGPPKTVNVKGNSSGTFITAALIKFEQNGFGLTSIFNGNNNFGGPYSGQNVTQYHINPPKCEFVPGSGIKDGYTLKAVSPDPANFVDGVLVANGVLNYNQGQLYLLSHDSASGKDGCILSDGRYWVNLTYEIVGGTGKYATASGWLYSTVRGQVLAAPDTYGSKGQFGAFQEDHTGEAMY